MARAEKVTAVAELTERFQSSDGAVLTEYRGLTVAQLAELRGSLGDSATFTVVKNTLTKIAANEAGVASQLGDLLIGPSAIAFVTGDVVDAARGLRDFSRANPLLVIKGGVLDGKAISPAEIERLAEPARPAPMRPAPMRPAPMRPAPMRPAPARPAPSSRTAGRPETTSRLTERKGTQQSWRSSALTTCSARSRR
jgi:large subunit ribosomal protein L10